MGRFQAVGGSCRASGRGTLKGAGRIRFVGAKKTGRYEITEQ